MISNKLKPTPRFLKNKWIPLWTLSLLFYGTMLFLTLTAKDIHNSRLPQVTTGHLGKQEFSYSVTYDNEYTKDFSGQFTAIPKELVDTGQIFIVESATKNGTTYYYAKKISLTIDTDKRNESYYAVSDSMYSYSSYILTGYETLKDGDEINIAN